MAKRVTRRRRNIRRAAIGTAVVGSGIAAALGIRAVRRRSRGFCGRKGPVPDFLRSVGLCPKRRGLAASLPFRQAAGQDLLSQLSIDPKGLDPLQNFIRKTARRARLRSLLPKGLKGLIS